MGQPVKAGVSGVWALSDCVLMGCLIFALQPIWLQSAMQKPLFRPWLVRLTRGGVVMEGARVAHGFGE